MPLFLSPFESRDALEEDVLRLLVYFDKDDKFTSLGIPEYLLTHPDSEKVCRQHKKNISGKRNFSQVLDV